MDDVFSYTLADADAESADDLEPDADKDTTTLTITITGVDDTAGISFTGAEQVDEAGLPFGSGEYSDGDEANDSDSSERVNGTISVSASDGIDDVVIGGITLTLADLQALDGTTEIDTGEGTLTLNSYTPTDGDAVELGGVIAYTYELDATIDNDSITPSGDDTVDDDAFNDSIAVTVNGIGGSLAEDDLVIEVLDDVPDAIADVDAIDEDAAPISGNVITGATADPNDTDGTGADTEGADRYATVYGVAVGSVASNVVIDDGVGATLYGSYGTLTMGSTGGYTYTQYTYDMAVALHTAADTAQDNLDAYGPDDGEPEYDDLVAARDEADALADQVEAGFAAIQALNGEQPAQGEDPAVPADTLDDVFSYTLADADASTDGSTADEDKDTTTLTITITGVDDTAGISFTGTEQVDEAGLPFGSGEYADGDEANDSDSSERVNGTISVSASDGIDDVVIGGITLTLADLQALDGTTEIDTGEGTLTLNSYTPTDGDAAELGGSIAYTYTLDATIDNDSIIPSGDDTVDDDAFNDSIAVTVNGIGGSLAEDDLVIEVLDDVPDAIADVDAIDEDAAPISGNVITGATADPNDTDGTGADTEGADRYATVYGVAVGSVASNVVIDDGVGATLYGSYGTLTMGSTGGYTYTQYTYDMAVALRTAADTAQDNLDAYGPDDGEPEYDDLVAARDEADALADQVEAGFAAIQALNGEQPAQGEDPAVPADTLDDVFSYTLADADASTDGSTADEDKDTTTLTITITGVDDTAGISFTGTEQVDEAGLPFGSGEYADGDEANDSDSSERVNGTISVSASDGIDDVVIGGITLTLADLQALDGTTEIDTGEGTLTLNSYTPTDGDAAELGGSIAYTYTLDATIDNDSIIPSGDDTVDDDAFNDSIAVTVNGIGGSLAEDDLVIEVLDDVPDAIADVDAIDEDAAPISGNVITGATADPNDTDGTGADTEGADRYATVYGVAVGSVASNVVIDDGVGATLYGSYGTLTMGSTGGYTYTQYTYDMAVALRTAADTAQDNLDAYGPDDGEPEYDDLVAARDEADALADQVEAGFAAIQALNGEQPAQGEDPAVPADTLDDVFSYTLADADAESADDLEPDADKDTTTLTITITGVDDTAGISFTGAEQVDEAGLPFGSGEYSDGDEANDSDSSERVNGTISVSASDGIDDVVIGGITLTLADLQALDGTTEIDTGEGTLTLNSYTPTDGDAVELGGVIAYTYELDATIDNDSITPSGDDTVDDDAFNDSIAVTVNGIGGSLAEDDLVIEVLDDVPDAIADVDAIDEDAAPISGNVITGATADPNDTDGTGADTEGADRYATVYGVAVGSVASNVVIDDGVGATLYGSYGTLTMGSTGGYTYTQYTYDMAVALHTAADTAQDNLDAYGPDDGEPEYDDLVAARDEADALADQVEAGFAAIQALNGEQPAQEKTQPYQLIHWMMSSAIPWRMRMLLPMDLPRMKIKTLQH
ncbi:beta strand repeat-containing protein [Neptuniibacter sp. QD37_6]|uniref:beta strand repeat-containing protein n=1 Tax=Neptuniibacter sp. QD37_6 TaxID=3398210 RepID=UPI0039F5052A